MNEFNEIFSIYKSYQSGDKNRLGALFRTDARGNVVLQYNILKKLVNAIKVEYRDKGKDFDGKHRKLHEGEYDVSEISEIYYLMLTEIFNAPPDKNGCITVNGKESTLPITDGVSLIKNISFFMDCFMNLYADITYQDVLCSFDEMEQENKKRLTVDEILCNEVLKHTEQKWIEYQSTGKRKWEYHNILRTFYEDIDSVYGLFREDSTAIKAIIKTILECEETFIPSEESGKEKLESRGNDLCIVMYSELCKIIKKHTGETLWENNISTCFSTIERKILEYFFYIPGKYHRLVDKNLIDVSVICTKYKDWKSFIRELRKYDDFLIDWKKEHRDNCDEVNLINGKIEQLSRPPDKVAYELKKSIEKEFQKKESDEILKVCNEYRIINKFRNGKMKFWDTYFNDIDSKIKFRFYSTESVKHPVEITIGLDNVIIYEGFEKYYIFDTSLKNVYALPKAKRKK